MSDEDVARLERRVGELEASLREAEMSADRWSQRHDEASEALDRSLVEQEKMLALIQRIAYPPEFLHSRSVASGLARDFLKARVADASKTVAERWENDHAASLADRHKGR